MALTRKFLSAMAVDEEKIEEIINAHVETVNGLKDKLSDAEEKAKQYDELETKYNEAVNKIKALESDNTDEYKEKYEAEVKAFEKYKADVEAEETLRKKDTAYRALLKEAGISEKRYDAIMKVTDLEGIELDGDNIKDKDKTLEAVKEEWSDFVVTQKQRGAKTDNPPTNGGSGATMTREQVRAIKDHAERQKAMIENASLFGIDTEE